MEYPQAMSLADFRLFQKMIYAEAGINLTDKKITLLTNRIRKRLRVLDIDTYRKYYLYLKDSEDKEKEIIKMIDAVTTNVTHFFRNPKQFNRFKDEILPGIIFKDSKKKSIRILSAGCSTGEEVYTIAIILMRYFERIVKDWFVEVEGVDICTDAVKKAETGIYKKDKLNEVEDKILNKYFTKINNNIFQIEKEVKSIVKFRKFNLKTDKFLTKYDIIFCRNVVIYFDKETKEHIYQKLHKALDSNGYFLIGHSEGLFNDKRFQYVSPGIYMKSSSLKIGNIKKPQINTD